MSLRDRLCAGILVAMLPSLAWPQVLCFVSTSGREAIRLQITLPRDASITVSIRSDTSEAATTLLR
jgi:hypothetical protein